MLRGKKEELEAERSGAGVRHLTAKLAEVEYLTHNKYIVTHPLIINETLHMTLLHVLHTDGMN